MLNKLFKIVVFNFCVFWMIKEIAVPVYGYFNYRDEYQVLVNECARAMENHWDIESSNEKNESLLRSSKTSLIVCHDYDKLRKLLLSFGINEYIWNFIFFCIINSVSCLIIAYNQADLYWEIVIS